MNKLRWHCPLPPAGTAIATFNLQLIPFLKETFSDFELWTYQNEVQALSGFEDVIVKRYRKDNFEINDNYIDVYHIGNNTDFHSDIFAHAKISPGYIILHDICLLNFVMGYYHKSDGSGVHELYEIIEKRHGQKAKQDFVDFFCSRVDMQFLYDHYLLTEEVVSYGKGIIVHSPHAIQILKDMGFDNVFYIPLAFNTSSVPKTVEKDNSRINIVFLGYIHANRRVLEFLDCLGNFKNKSKFEINIFGSFYDRPALEENLKKNKLVKQVHFRGEVNDTELGAELDKAHIGVNLRYPTMHEVSASQLYFFKHALPVISTNIGWYTSLPDSVTIKINMEKECPEIHETLQRLIEEPEYFHKMGIDAQKYFLDNHLPQNYVRKLADVLRAKG